MNARNVSFKICVSENQDKKVFFYGCGERFYELLDKYADYVNIMHISGVIDINKVGQIVTINSQQYEIMGLKDFIRIADESTTLIVTVWSSEEILESLDKITELNNIYCYSYKWMVYCDYDEKIYSAKLPENAIEHFIMQIPKKIHYCWFGKGEMSELNKKCIESWMKFCPDYEIVRWDESNYDVTKNKYMYEAYKAKKWAFVSDYARLDVVHKYGGIYLDTDLELLKSLDSLLYEKGFCGFENVENVNFGLGFGAAKANLIIKAILDFYENLEWDGGKIACPIYQTDILKKFGLDASGSFQRLNDMVILPAECLCGKSLYSRRMMITDNTFSIHHYAASWLDEAETRNVKLRESL